MRIDLAREALTALLAGLAAKKNENEIWLKNDSEYKITIEIHKKGYILRSYYKNGNLESMINYKNNIENGACLRYYESGQLRSKSNYKDGRLHGDACDYYSSGQPQYKWTFKDGVAGYELQNCHADGQLKDTYSFNLKEKSS